jgi:hypothetical protein
MKSSSRRDESERRRQDLQLQCALERDLFAADVATIHRQLGGIDRVVGATRSFVRRPGVILAGLVALAIVGPARIVRLASRGLVLIAAARRVVALVKR